MNYYDSEPADSDAVCPDLGSGHPELDVAPSSPRHIPPPELLCPLGSRVTIRLDSEFDSEMSSGEFGAQIMIPDSTKERRPATGTVVRIGPEVTTLVPGDRVLCVKFAGINIPMPADRGDEEGFWCVYYQEECLGAWDVPVPTVPVNAGDEGRAGETQGAPSSAEGTCPTGGCLVHLDDGAQNEGVEGVPQDPPVPVVRPPEMLGH